MAKEEKVVNYYVLCNKLKNVIRTGWQNWHVNKDRIESVAEHIYGVQMLAIAMKSEFEYDIDIMKVIYMLAIHELGETVIGDLVKFDDKYKDKNQREHEVIHQILEPLIDGKYIEEIFLEYDEHKTKESIFAYQCDKLECDIQCKLYDQEGTVDLAKQEDNISYNDEFVSRLLSDGKSWSEMWLEYWREKGPYDANFKAVSEYVENNDI